MLQQVQLWFPITAAGTNTKCFLLVCASILFALSPLIFIKTFKVGPIINLICQMRMRFSSLARVAQTAQRWLSPQSLLVTMSQCCLLAPYKLYHLPHTYSFSLSIPSLRTRNGLSLLLLPLPLSRVQEVLIITHLLSCLTSWSLYLVFSSSSSFRLLLTI